MIVASKTNIKKACKGKKLQAGGKCPHKGPMMRKKKKVMKKVQNMDKRLSKVEGKVNSMEKGGKSDIHIKPSMEGTFTEWCKRQGFSGVTSECISRGKASKDARIRKKATFADNSREWNHG